MAIAKSNSLKIPNFIASGFPPKYVILLFSFIFFLNSKSKYSSAGVKTNPREKSKDLYSLSVESLFKRSSIIATCE